MNLHLLLLLSACLLIPQQSEFIGGRIVNSLNGSPVPFATVRLQDARMGVYANAGGDFRIGTNQAFLNDSLVITSIGYSKKVVAYKDLLGDKINTIAIVPSVYGLGEVTVKAKRGRINPLLVVSRAIRNIQNNCPMKPFSYIAYYRDYQKEGDAYLNLHEALIHASDDGYGSKSSDNSYRLLDFRKNSEFREFDVSPYYSKSDDGRTAGDDKYIPSASIGDQYGNELFILMVHDPLRNYQVRSFSYIEVMSEQFLLNHSFGTPKIVLNNNLPLLRIPFNARINKLDSLEAGGAIYIQESDYSIHRLEYTCRYLNRQLLNREMFNIELEYGREEAADSKMCLKYISFNNYFRVPDPSDSAVFKVVNADWETAPDTRPRLVLKFNSKPDPASAVKKSNYKLTINDISRKIESVSVSGKNIYILADMKKNPETKGNKISTDDLKNSRIAVRGIYDMDGRLVDHRKSIEMKQYRELFVQEYNRPVSFSDSCIMEYKPLEENCITRFEGLSRYWMNTPLKDR